MKYSVRGLVLLTHWILEFMKHVLPRLLKPVAPFSVGTGTKMGQNLYKFIRETEVLDFTGTTTWVLSPWSSITQYFIEFDANSESLNVKADVCLDMAFILLCHVITSWTLAAFVPVLIIYLICALIQETRLKNCIIVPSR